VKRIQLYKRLVNRRCVIVSKLGEIEFAQVTVDLVGIAALAIFREILINDFRAAQVGKAQTDYTKRIRYTVFVVFFIILVEVITNRLPVIEHRM